MARLGNKVTDHPTEGGRLYFGDKDVEYLKKMSRQALEEHNDAPILYFGIDWEQSKRNFYGEMMIKKFVNPKGTQIRGSYKIYQASPNNTMGFLAKKMKMNVSVYTEQLEELGIEPTYGDYFAIGVRLYCIHDMTIKDAGVGNVMMNRERMRVDYVAFEEDDEALQKDIWGDSLSLEYQINKQIGENLR